MWGGYANLNVGFFCSTADGSVTTNRRLRLKSLSFERVMDLFERNLADFQRLLEISARMGCKIFRLGSDLIPLASHPQFPKDWFKFFEEPLKAFAKKLKNFEIRITMHPGQFVVLNSPKREVVEASLRELEYHFWLLDSLEVGPEGIVVVHGGGLFGDREESLRRLLRTLKNQSWLKERLALENDERHYSIAALFPVAELGYPLVFDYYHHRLNPSQFNPEKLVETWGRRRPEFHLSSLPQRPHRFGEHGDWIDPHDFLELLDLFRNHSFDLIIEAKQKEKAIQKLSEDLRRDYRNA